MRALIVDDNSTVLEVLETILKRPETQIDKAQNCREALDSLAKNTYDWVTLDLKLPDGSGIDLLKHIRGEHSGVRVVIVSVSASNPLLKKKLLSLGADMVLPKPFPPEVLLEFIYGEQDIETQSS